MDPFAFALPIEVNYVVGSATQVDISFLITGGDGAGNSVVFQTDYIWDASLAVSENLSALKTAIVNQAASQYNVTLLSTNVNILMAVS